MGPDIRTVFILLQADGPFKWIYVIIGTYFCCIRVFIIVGLSKVNASPNKPN